MAEIAFSTRVTQDAHVMPSIPRLNPASLEAAGMRTLVCSFRARSAKVESRFAARSSEL